jgi:hypothetical protein
VASEVLVLSAALPTTAYYYCELDDITSAAGFVGTFGPVTPSNGAVTFVNAAGGSGAPELTAGHTYLFQFYQLAIPAPTPTPTATATATATASATPTATPVPTATPIATATPVGTATAVPAFTFSGPSASAPSVNPPAAPAALVVPATGSYGTYGAQATIAWGASTGSSAYALSAALGSTASDISPAGQFPFYTGSAATPLFYVLLSSTASVTFAQTPAISVTVSNGFGSNNVCGLYIYANTGGSAFAWIAVPGAQGSVSGNTVMIPAAGPPAGQTINIVPGQTSLAFVGC